MKLSIIVPVYNEEKTIGKVLEILSNLRFSLHNLEKEIVIVDDGSTDGTKEILSKLKVRSPGSEVQGPRCKVIFHERNQGKGMAIRTGLKEASGEVVTIQDADLEYNPQELEKLLLPIIKNNVGVVYGSRFLQENPTLYRRYYWGNKFLSFLISVLYGVKVTDAYTGYKMFKKEALKNIRLTSKRFEFEAEITCKLLKNGYKILEIPISYQPRSLKEGKKIFWKDGFLGIWTILRIRFFQ